MSVPYTETTALATWAKAREIAQEEGPTWGTLPDRPEVVAAGGTAREARSAIQAVQGDEISDSFGMSFTVVDEDGRRTWLEADLSGNPTERTLDILGTPQPILDSSGIAFVVVDEDGKRTDLEVGLDGHLSQRVIDQIAPRVIAASVDTDSDPVELVLPSKFDLIVGQTVRLYYKGVVDKLGSDQRVIATGSGSQSGGGQFWQPTTTVATSSAASFSVLDRTDEIIRTRTAQIQSYAAPGAGPRRHMSIGDSITYNGDYSARAAALTGGATCGIRVGWGGSSAFIEGRGGWKLSNYTTQVDSATDSVSPFLFPDNVAGPRYVGASRFWANVQATPAAYGIAGFQKISKGWVDAGPHLYTAAGYPVTPVEGDVINDTGQYKQYISGTWQNIATPTMEFNFSKYMERYAVAFPDGGPTSISIMLGTNDWYSAADEDSWTTWKTRMDTVIASIRAWSPTVAIILIVPPIGASADLWEGVIGSTTKYDFDARILFVAQRMIADYDTASQRSGRVYFTYFPGALQPGAIHMTDHLHPNAAGHTALGDRLAGTLSRLVSEGVI